MTAPSTSASTPVRVRPAATVMLVRDAPDLEVLMLRRSLDSDFVGGAYVFPGGAVDDGDHAVDLQAVCPGRTDHEAGITLGLEGGGLAFWVAAVRECFEEAGVLLARHRDTGEVVDFADPAVAERFEAYRRAVAAGELGVLDVAREEDLVLDVRGMHYFSHWITPVGAHRRYDTRFFVTAAPPGQTPLHDDAETIASEWVRPADALERAERGEMELIFPTFRSLETIGRFASSAELLEAAAGIQSVATIQPRIVTDGHGARIVLPGDPEYDRHDDPPEGSVRIPTATAVVASAAAVPSAVPSREDADA